MKKYLGLVLLFLACIAVTVGGDSLSTLFSVGFSHELKHVSKETITRDVGKFKYSMGFDNGTATDSAQANAVYTVQAQVSSGTRVSYDLQSLTDAFGGSIVFNRIKGFALKNLDGTDSVIIGSGTTPWAFGMATQTTVTIPPYGVYCLSWPYAGADASVAARLIKIEGAAAVASFDLVILGVE